MKTGCIIFSRFTSTRLPGKALLDIAGRPLLGRVLDRVRRIEGICSIALATSEEASDDPIAAFGHSERIDVFRGDLDDVGDRALACAQWMGVDAFVRMCGDRVFLDPDLNTRLVAVQREAGADLATNFRLGQPVAGTMAEVISTAALSRAQASPDLTDDDREHVTPYFYRNAARFRIVTLDAAGAVPPGMRLVVDDARDLAHARWLAERLGPLPERASMARIVEISAAFERAADARAGCP